MFLFFLISTSFVVTREFTHGKTGPLGFSHTHRLLPLTPMPQAPAIDPGAVNPISVSGTRDHHATLLSALPPLPPPCLFFPSPHLPCSFAHRNLPLAPVRQVQGPALASMVGCTQDLQGEPQSWGPSVISWKGKGRKKLCGSDSCLGGGLSVCDRQSPLFISQSLHARETEPAHPPSIPGRRAVFMVYLEV